MSDRHIIITPHDSPLPIDQAAEAIKNALDSLVAEGAAGHPEGTLLEFRQPLLPTDPMEWLAAQKAWPKIFWRNRERDFTAAGIGVADSVSFDGQTQNDTVFRRLGTRMAEKSPSARYFGGMAFNSLEERAPEWGNFPACSFLLPQVELAMEGGEHTLCCRLIAGTPEESAEKTDRVRALLGSLKPAGAGQAPPIPPVSSRSCSPDREGWIESCRKAIGSFEEGSTEKIMLARRTTIEFEAPFDPMLILLRHPYPENATYRFYFEPEEGSAFLSFTPERLYRRDGRTLLTEALAGTCSKEERELSDEHASAALLASEKDIREHRFVKDMIQRELGPACSRIQMEDEVQVLQLNRLAHLYARCTAELKPECSGDRELLSILHPTPAVGGVPKEEAMRRILELEPFSRGWYAGPVGWISRDSSELAVGIRSALVRSAMACLYSGAGLVRGSDPELEWDEVEQKIGDLAAITGATR